jgi:hypothetical protein
MTTLLPLAKNFRTRGPLQLPVQETTVKMKTKVPSLMVMVASYSTMQVGKIT